MSSVLSMDPELSYVIVALLDIGGSGTKSDLRNCLSKGWSQSKGDLVGFINHALNTAITMGYVVQEGSKYVLQEKCTEAAASQSSVITTEPPNKSFANSSTSLISNSSSHIVASSSYDADWEDNYDFLNEYTDGSDETEELNE